MRFSVPRQAASHSLAVAIALAFASSHSIAAPDAPDAAPETAADTVVVTATRTPQRVDEVIADVVVIGSDEIRHAGAGSVADVLRRQRGIEIVRNGGAGTNTSVFLRGANANQVVVLVDGVRIGSSTSGIAAWNAIPLSAIDHIEVVYGPLSALYGADAIGGVVQIFTKKGDGKPAFSASAGGGTYGTNQYDASVRGSTGGDHAVSYALAAAHEEADGFSATRPGAYGYNPDADGYTRNSVNGRLTWQLAAGHEIGAQFLKSRLNAQYDNGAGDYDAHNTQDLDNYAVFLNDRFLPNWQSTVQVARSWDKSGNFGGTGPYDTGRIDTRQDELTWQNTITLGPDTLQVLLNHRKEDVAASSPAELTRSRITNSAAVSYDLKRGSHLLDVSVRRDHSDYGGKTTGAVGYSYAILQDLRATASYGTSFRAPTFNELYYPGYGFAGNKPEHGRNVEAGLRYRLGDTELQGNWYRNRVTDLIVNATPCPSPTVTGSCAYNVDHAVLEGWTLSSDTQLGSWDLRANVDLQDPRDETTGKQLARRSRRHVGLTADYTLGVVQAGAEVQATGARYDDTANARRLGGYGLLNLYTTWQVSPDWSLLLRVDNAANKHYELARNYGTAGRSFFAALRYGIR